MLIKLYADAKSVADLIEKGITLVGKLQGNGYCDTVEIVVDTNDYIVRRGVGATDSFSFIVSAKPAEKKVI
jgi:hypothetical protein